MRGWRVLQKKNLTPLYDTRAALLRTYQNPVDEKPLWQMPRFTKSVSAFLSPDENARARVCVCVCVCVEVFVFTSCADSG